VTVKGYVDRLVVVAEGQIVATHKRSSAQHTMILEPIHYLATLGRKPGALDHSPVFRDWKLPASFADFRAVLEQHHGAMPGSRQFVRVLQLLGDHPLDRVRRAVEACQLEHLVSAEAVIERTRGFAAIESHANRSSPAVLDSILASQVDVPLPDLSRFNQLLGGPVSQGELPDDLSTVRTDVAPPEGRNHVSFAKCHRIALSRGGPGGTVHDAGEDHQDRDERENRGGPGGNSPRASASDLVRVRVQ
jgi:hypothetical protein